MSENCAPHSARHSGLPHTCSALDTHEISEVQQWYRYAVAQALLGRYQRKGDDFLGRIGAMDETWSRSLEPNLKRRAKEWKYPGSPRPKKVATFPLVPVQEGL